MKPFIKPMLAASLLPPGVEHSDEVILAAMKELRYSVLATVKCDGIRGIKLGDLASRTLKKIPNLYLQGQSQLLPYYLDCELWNPDMQYDEIESIVMSREHPREKEIKFYVLDIYCEKPYIERMYHIDSLTLPNFCIFTPPLLVESPTALFNYFKSVEEFEGEGICFRTPQSPYKQGRSTLKEQYLVKLARFTTGEAIIIGFIEQQMNTNSEKRNGVGNMDRSKRQSGMVGKGTLGALMVKDVVTGAEFKLGTGFNDAIREHIWNHRNEYINKQVTYKCKKHGEKVAPRSPVFKGMRVEGY